MGVDGAVDHDGSTPIEQRQQRLDLEVSALDVGVEGVVPRRLVHVRKRGELHDTGIDEYRVELDVASGKGRRQRLGGGAVAGIAAQGHSFAAKQCAGLLQRLRVAACDEHTSSLRGKRAGGCQSDSTASARHQHCLAFETTHDNLLRSDEIR